MLKITAPASSLTTFIVADGETLHFNSPQLDMLAAKTDTFNSVPLHSLAIHPGVSSHAIHRRLADITRASASEIANHLAPIDSEIPFFCLAQYQNSQQHACLYLPVSQYRSVKNALRLNGPDSMLGFPISLSSLQPAVPSLIPGKPDPLALLFHLENRILCHAVPRLEIGISTTNRYAPPRIPALCPEYQSA